MTIGAAAASAQPKRSPPNHATTRDAPDVGFDLSGALRRIRRRADLSQRELARAIQAAKSTIAAAESDDPTTDLERRRELIRDRLDAGDTFVFSRTADYSQPWKPKSVTQKYRKMASRLRLRSIRLHALRHYSATELIAAGTDLSGREDGLARADLEAL